FGQVGRILIAAFLEITAQQEVLLQRFHVFLEGSDSYLGMVDRVTQPDSRLVQFCVNLFIVHQSPDGSLTLVDLAANGTQVRGDHGDVIQGLLAGVQNAVGLLHEVGNDQGRFADDRVVVFYVRGLGGTKGDGDIFVPQQALGFDGSHGVLFDDVVRRSLEIHQHGYFTVRLVRQLDPPHAAAVHATHAHVRARVEANYRSELRLQSIGGSEEVLFAPDDKDSSRQNRQRCNDKCSESRRS